MKQIENQERDEEDVEQRFTLTLDYRLLHRIEALIRAPELGFSSVQHFLSAALYSFVSYKEKVLRGMRGEGRR